MAALHTKICGCLPSRSNFVHVHAFCGKIWPNNRLVPSLELVTSGFAAATGAAADPEILLSRNKNRRGSERAKEGPPLGSIFFYFRAVFGICFSSNRLGLPSGESWIRLKSPQVPFSRSKISADFLFFIFTEFIRECQHIFGDADTLLQCRIQKLDMLGMGHQT